MTNLSPAADAVLDAYMANCGWRLDGPLKKDYRCTAAALRAAAMHLRSEEYAICNGSSYAMMIEVDDLLDLATELEGNYPESPDSSDEPAVFDGREPASVAIQPSDDAIAAPLSPAAKAVLGAFWNGLYCGDDWGNANLAALLRAAADQVVPLPRLPYDSCCDVSASAIRAELMAIAAELEGNA